MACPFFAPERRIESAHWAIPPRYPLGDAYLGRCVAPNGPAELPEDRQESVCNFGYAKGRCDCFPQQGAADAVRFSMTREEHAERLIFIYEIEHAPVSHGVIDGSEREPLAGQARAYAASYRRRLQRPE